MNPSIPLQVWIQGFAVRGWPTLIFPTQFIPFGNDETGLRKLLAEEETYFSIVVPSHENFVFEPDGTLAVDDFKTAGFLPASILYCTLQLVESDLGCSDLVGRVRRLHLAHVNPDNLERCKAALKGVKSVRRYFMRSLLY